MIFEEENAKIKNSRIENSIIFEFFCRCVDKRIIIRVIMVRDKRENDKGSFINKKEIAWELLILIIFINDHSRIKNSVSTNQ